MNRDIKSNRSEWMVIHINGHPGVGKMAITKILNERLKGRLLDNHSIYNLALALAEFKSVVSRISDDVVAWVLGSFRVDALYLLPVHYPFKNCVVLTDFARNRDEFHLVTFPGHVPSAIKRLPRQNPDPSPPRKEIWKFATREYPDLIRSWKMTQEAGNLAE